MFPTLVERVTEYKVSGSRSDKMAGGERTVILLRLPSPRPLYVHKEIYIYIKLNCKQYLDISHH
jgi:hypothetical protein